MDKELLRIVIIAVGTVIFLTMVLWNVVKNRKQRSEMSFYDDNDPLENVQPDLEVQAEDEFEVSAVKVRPTVTTKSTAQPIAEEQALPDVLLDSEVAAPVAPSAPIPAQLRTVRSRVSQPTIKKTLPALINLNIVAKNGADFTGYQLLEAFKKVELVYGSVKVFERLDVNNQVDYAVASMSQSGVFDIAEDEWEAYRCAGISLFLQPREVEQPKKVFDDMVNTVGILSSILKGDILDAQQQVLTAESLAEIDKSLE